MLWNWYTIDSCKYPIFLHHTLPSRNAQLLPTSSRIYLLTPIKASLPAHGASNPKAPSPAPASALSSSSSSSNSCAAPAKNTTATSSTSTARHLPRTFHRLLAVQRESTITTRSPLPRSPHQFPRRHAFARVYCSKRSARCCTCCSLRWRTLSCCWPCTTMGTS